MQSTRFGVLGWSPQNDMNSMLLSENTTKRKIAERKVQDVKNRLNWLTQNLSGEIKRKWYYKYLPKRAYIWDRYRLLMVEGYEENRVTNDSNSTSQEIWW